MTMLSGKTALVTGASRGIGRATALALAEAGAQVLVHYGQRAGEAEAVVARDPRRRRPRRGDRSRPQRARWAAQARQPGACHRRRPAGHPGRQCRHRQGGADRGDHRRGFRRPVRGQCPRALLPRAAAAARSCAKAAASCSFPRWRRMRRSARFTPMPRPRAPSTPWSSISPRCSGREASA